MDIAMIYEKIAGYKVKPDKRKETISIFSKLKNYAERGDGANFESAMTKVIENLIDALGRLAEDNPDDIELINNFISRLQTLLETKSKNFETLSNIMKKINSSSGNLIKNIK